MTYFEEGSNHAVGGRYELEQERSAMRVGRVRALPFRGDRRRPSASAHRTERSGAAADRREQQAARSTGHGAIPRNEGRSGDAAQSRGLPAGRSRRARQPEARRRRLGQRRMLGRWRKQPLPSSGDCLARLPRDRRRPHLERTGRTTPRAAHAAETRRDSAGPHSRIGSDRGHRLGTRGKSTRRQSVLRAHRPGRGGGVGLELRRTASDTGRCRRSGSVFSC